MGVVIVIIKVYERLITIGESIEVKVFRRAIFFPKSKVFNRQGIFESSLPSIDTISCPFEEIIVLRNT